MKQKRVEKLIQQIVIRLVEIDSNLSKSMYIGGPEDYGDDQPPTGDDYNLLWDAIIDECNAVCPGAWGREMKKHIKPDLWRD